MVSIYQHLYSEIQRLQKRLEQVESELEILKEQSSQKAGHINYHIENLYVESISNGILDLGVHMGDELDKRIQTQGSSAAPGGTSGSNHQQGDGLVTQLQHEVLEIQTDLRELEERVQQLEQRIRILEELHA